MCFRSVVFTERQPSGPTTRRTEGPERRAALPLRPGGRPAVLCQVVPRSARVLPLLAAGQSAQQNIPLPGRTRRQRR